MRRLIPFVLIGALLAGCGALNTPVPTPDDSMIATQVAQILTTVPTTAPQVVSSSPTSELPTIPPTEEPKGMPTETATAAPAQAQPTIEPTAAPTQAAQQPTATIAFTPPPDDPVLKYGTPTWQDDMSQDSNWPVGSDKFTSVEFADGMMKLTGLTTTDGWRLSLPEVSNFYLEMTFQTNACTGSDRYGIIYRVPDSKNPNKGYLLGFTCDGQYSLRRWNADIGAKGEMVNLISWTTSSAILTGSNQVNRMGMMAVGDRLIVYANGHLLGEVKDSTFQKGYFGVFVGARESTDLQIRIDQARYWENPPL